MKRRKLLKNTKGGVAVYVMIMFGLTFMLYLFGYSSIWTTYQDISLGGEELLVNETGGEGTETDYFGKQVIDMLANSLDAQILIGGGIFAAIGLFLTNRFIGGQAAATILQYAIPVLLLVILNIFIFPIGSLADSIAFMDAAGIAISGFLFAFFNIFYILAVLEFIRGNI